MNAITINCPHCKTKLNIPEELQCQEVVCPECEGDVSTLNVKPKTNKLKVKKRPLPKAEKTCPFCSEKVKYDAAKCKHCGEFFNQHAGQTTNHNKPKKDRGAYIILGLFFGLIGVHNFYARRFREGVMQLILTTLLFWTVIVPIGICVWVIIELCTVNADGEGIPFV